jgi:DNA-binding beta-propeller fold protein YncE
MALLAWTPSVPANNLPANRDGIPAATPSAADQRSTVFVISPYTNSGAVVHTMYNSTNVLRTIEDILGVNHLGLNDANAFPMSDVFIREPNLQPYVAPIPGILCEPPVDPTLVPECKNPGNRPITAAVKPLHDGAWWAQATKGFNFNHPDMINSDLFNRILWRGIMGDDKPYPKAGIKLAGREAEDTDRD